MSQNAAVFTLDARVDDDNQLILSATVDDDEFRVTGLNDLIAGCAGLDTAILQVRDFYQNGTVYQVFGVVLDDDGHKIRAYWQRDPSEAGIEHRFDIPGPGEGRPARFVIGARPLMSGAGSPKPVAPGHHDPVSLDKEQGPEDDK